MRSFQRSALTLIVLFFQFTTAVAQDVTTRRVSDCVIVLSISNLGMHTNVTVIESQKGLVVIETEITPFVMNKIKEAAEKYLGRDDWAYVINTHNHLHHAGGNGLFKDVQIIGHKNMRVDWLKDLLSTDKGRRQYCDITGASQGINNLSRLLKQNTTTPAQKKEIQRRINFIREVEKEILAGFEVRNPDISFQDRLTLYLGDIHLRLIYWGDAIKHYSICIHIIEENTLVSLGVAGKGLPGDFDDKASLSSIRRYASVLRDLTNDNIKIDTIIPVHSPDFNVTQQDLRNRYEYLQDLLDGITKTKQQGLSLKQVKREFAFDKRYSRFHKVCVLPEDFNKIHQDSINQIWKLLNEEESPDSSRQ